MAIGTTGAILGAAAVGGISSILSGLIGSEAANSAATIQEKAAMADVALQQQGLDYMRSTTERSRNDTLPWMEGGRNALDQVMVEMGLPPLTAARAQPGPVSTAAGAAGTTTAGTTTGAASGGYITPVGTPSGVVSDRGGSKARVGEYDTVSGMPPSGQHGAPPSGVTTSGGVTTPVTTGTTNTTDAGAGGTTAPVTPAAVTQPMGVGFQKTPGYDFEVKEGERGVMNNLAAAGMKGSGAALKALTRFRQGIANQSYGTWLTRLTNLATGGQQQVNDTNALSMSGAGGVMSGLRGIGGAGQDAAAMRASGFTGGANAWMGALNNFSNNTGNALGWLSSGYGGGGR